jgi:peptidase M28-like protein/PA domain-containing protein
MAQLDAKARELVASEELARTVTYLCGLGEKVAGSEEERKACDYLVNRLKTYGYQPIVHEFESYISYPRSASLVVSVAGKRIDISAVGVAFGQSTAKDGITEEVVLVGSGGDAEYIGKDVRGKVVLVTKLPSPANALSAAKAGARGMICMSAGKQRHKMIITPVWGTPEFQQVDRIPRLPVVSIAKSDGDRIIAALQEGRVRATLITDTFEGWRKVRLPTAELKGREPEFSLVGAHYCSWFDGSTDNVSGDACVLELARVLKAFEGKLRYGIRFAWWPGHSHGRYSGSTWYADTHWHELHDNAIVYFNIDSPGVKGATVYVPRHQMAEVAAFNETMTTEVTGWTTITSANAQLALGKRADKYVSPTRPSRAADQSFWGIGVSSMSVYSMLTPDDANRDPNVGGSGGAWWWHSEHETIDKFDAGILVQDTRLYASILLTIATASLLPLKVAAIAEDFQDSLKEYAEEAGDFLPFDELIADVNELKARLQQLQTECTRLQDECATAAANRLFLRLARTLNPVLYQVCSPFEHDPALGSRALPSLAPALRLKFMHPESDAFKFTVVGLRRRINRIRHQVREAMREVDLEPAQPR